MTITTAHNPVNMSAVNTFGDMIQAMNNSAGGLLFFVINLLVFFVLWISLAGSYGWEASLLASAFVGLILSLLFLYMEVLSLTYVSIFVGLIVIMIMYVMWSSRSSLT